MNSRYTSVSAQLASLHLATAWSYYYLFLRGPVTDWLGDLCVRAV